MRTFLIGGESFDMPLEVASFTAAFDALEALSQTKLDAPKESELQEQARAAKAVKAHKAELARKAAEALEEKRKAEADAKKNTIALNTGAN